LVISLIVAVFQKEQEKHINNCFAYIDQLDKHAPLLTVAETFKFSLMCKTAGKVYEREIRPGREDYDNVLEAARRADREDLILKLITHGLGLEGVVDTFVGNTNMRGVSGGQRRRVTVGEMLVGRASILCGDEISTGLDAESTYSMCDLLIRFGKASQCTRILSLLQPSPETVSLFDDVVVLAQGFCIFAGPVAAVEHYFAGIGFTCPSFMDTGDFLQMVSSGDSSVLFDPKKSKLTATPSASELAEMFRNSKFGNRLEESIRVPCKFQWMSARFDAEDDAIVLPIPAMVKQKYANTFLVSTWLIMHRFLLLWTRDKRVIIAGLAKNIIMGVSVGGCYLSTMDVISIQGALFQAGLFIILGT
jgi:ABC-type multidrug transport system ATPase subunit